VREVLDEFRGTEWHLKPDGSLDFRAGESVTRSLGQSVALDLGFLVVSVARELDPTIHWQVLADVLPEGAGPKTRRAYRYISASVACQPNGFPPDRGYRVIGDALLEINSGDDRLADLVSVLLSHPRFLNFDSEEVEDLSDWTR